jgi:hypothetical protein
MARQPVQTVAASDLERPVPEIADIHPGKIE